MLNHKKNLNNESGFILVLTMLILVVLTLIGTSATRTTNIELQIAGNEKWSQEAFYRADGGTEVGLEMVEQNFACAVGFKRAPTSFDDDDPSTFFSIGGIDIFDKRFAYDKLMTDVARTGTAPAQLADLPTDTIRSMRIPEFPENRDDLTRHTNIAVYSSTDYAEGSAIQMAAGYEGKGHGAAGGGGIKSVDIISEHIGRKNAVSKIVLRWKHLIGQEGNCIY